MELKSPAFEDGGAIPPEHTCDGKDISPPLEWTDPPPGVEEFALLMEDLDAPREHRFFNWIMYNIPGPIRQFPEAIPQEGRENWLIARQGTNSFSYDNHGYRGPAPLEGKGPRRYRITLYALKQRMRLRVGASGEELLRAMEGLVIDEATLSGTYER